ncbi:MAG: hypothetical protein IJS14_03975 [Lentisphaeria bacterium]|nr:hypothetical protein [Lentisphaeria bacterium]
MFFDFGKHYFAVLEIEADAETAQEIMLAVGEVLAGDGKIERKPGGSRIYQEETVMLRPGHNRIVMTMFHPGYNAGTLPIRPNAVPFRYAEVRGLSGPVRAFQHAYFYEFDDTAADFVSSSDDLNRIWEFCKHTMKATTPFGVFIDGNRERQAYEGDTYINQLSYFVCQSDRKIARATIERLFAFPTWPTEWWLSMIPIIHDYALYTGDLESVRRWYEPMKKKTLLDGVCGNGLLNVGTLPPGFKCPGFGEAVKLRDIVDWPQGERDGYELSPDFNLVPNCWHSMALRRTAAVAELLGKREDRAFYLAAAERSRKAIRGSMLKNGLFVDNPGSDHTALHSCIFPALWNVAEESEKPAILALMQSKGMACSVFGAQFLLECCYENRLADYGLSLIVSDGIRSWKNMLAKGATITMEAWDDSFKPNQDWNHPWGAAPGNIIVRYICGIRPLEPGFRKFIVDPQPGPLGRFRVKTPTPCGPVLLEMDGPGHYRLTVPEGTEAVYRGRIFAAGEHTL